MNRSAKGRRREHQARDQLIAEGYTVTRAAASKGAWDLIAWDGSHFRLVQIKCNSWPGRAEMARLRACITPPGTKREVWRYDDGKTIPTICEVISTYK